MVVVTIWRKINYTFVHLKNSKKRENNIALLFISAKKIAKIFDLMKRNISAYASETDSNFLKDWINFIVLRLYRNSFSYKEKIFAYVIKINK